MIVLNRLLFPVLVALFLTVSVIALADYQGPPLNPDVREETIKQTICVPGYTQSVRPSSSYTNGIKLRLLRQRNEDPENMQLYQLDHIIALSLGGHPRSPSNLQLLEWEKANAKDHIARKLHCLVCAGQMALGAAQQINQDWKQHAPRIVAIQCNRNSLRP